MTFEQIARRYSTSTRFTKLAESSKESYSYAIDVAVEFFGKKPIAEIRRSDFIRLQTEKAKTPGMTNLVIRVCSVIFEFAVDLDLIPFNPAAGVKKEKGGSHVRWETDEVTKAVNAGLRVTSTAVALAWYTGQRECDILEMRWRDIKDGYLCVTQQKTGVEMQIKLHPDIIAFLAKQRGNEPDHCFIVSGFKEMSGAAFRGMFRRHMRKIGIDKTFHGIRKGVASSLAEGRATTKEIAAIMGHRTTKMAEYYAEQANQKRLTENAVSQLVSVTD